MAYYRKLRGDIIEAYKMTNGHYVNDIPPPIDIIKGIHTMQTRGCRVKLRKSNIKRASRANFFKNRVVNFWNELPTKVTEAPSITSFERRLDKYWKKYEIKYDFDKCLDFEKIRTDPDYAGTGQRNILLNIKDNLELQVI